MLLVTKLLNLRLTVLCFDLKLQGVYLIYCVEKNCPTYKEVEEGADTMDGGDGSDGEDLVDGAHGYPPTLRPGPVEPDCPPRGQVRFVEYPYEDWSPHWVGWEHDDVSLTK